MKSLHLCQARELLFIGKLGEDVQVLSSECSLFQALCGARRQHDILSERCSLVGDET